MDTGFPTIRKAGSRAPVLAPNMPSYLRERQTFDWRAARERLHGGYRCGG